MVSREADPLSARAVFAGLLVGFVVSAMNVSFGLKAGWAQGGSVLSAAISIGFFAALRPEVPFTPLEANICQTVASAAGSMTMAAGLIGPIPALHMLGLRYGVLTLMTWGASVAFLGVFMAVPLRKHFLVDSQLRFPSGTATAETIRSMFADANRAKEQVTTLIRAAAAASALTVLTWAVPWLLRPPLLAVAGFPKLAALGFGIRVDATLVGGGVLMGTRVGLSILMGSWFAYGVLAPYAESRGWVSGDPLNMRGGARGLLLWPGVAAMATDSLTQLAAAVAPALASRLRRRARRGKTGAKTNARGVGDGNGVGNGVGVGNANGNGIGNGNGSAFASVAGEGGGVLLRDVGVGEAPASPSGVNPNPKHLDSGTPRGTLAAGPTLVGWGGVQTRRSSLDGDEARDVPPPVVDDHPDEIPRRWWVLGLTATSIATAWSLTSSFGMALWQPLLAIPVAGVMSYIAVRCTGETDINPIGPMGKIIQLVFAFAAPGNVVTNLMAAAVACGGAGQAGDLMHDFKAGMMMRLSPRKQLLAQLAGIPAGILGAVPAYALFRDAYPLGGEQFPAPAAVAWRAVAEVLTSSVEGGGGLPAEAKTLMAISAAATVAIRLAERAGAEGRRWRWTRYLPSPTSFGIAFIIPPEFSAAVAVGAAGGGWWAAKHPAHHEDHAHVAASGLLAGAGVTGVITAMVSMARG